MIGEVFIYNNLENTQALLQEAKKKKVEEINNIDLKIEEIQAVMTKLKAELYGKFGQKNIYLENDED